MRRCIYGLPLILFFAAAGHAQTLEGDWQGTLKVGAAELRLVLHVMKDEKGGLRATLDSPDQNVMGIPVTTLSHVDSAVRFEIQRIGGAYEGKATTDRTAISGTWTQGGSAFPLDLTRALPAAPPKTRIPKPSDIDGSWDGTLNAGAQTFRLGLHITGYEDGLGARMDSLDQNALGLPVTTIARDGAKLKLEMKQIGGSFEATLDSELSTLTGTWTQGGNSMPLVLKRRPAAK